MSSERTVFVVTTLPNSAIAKQISQEAMQARIDVARAALAADINAGYRVVALCESEMVSSFDDLLDDESQLIPDPGMSKSMGYGRRLVINTALQICRKRRQFGNIIVWREPEKNLAPFIPAIIRPILDDNAHIVVPRRKSLASYPTFSQYWEATGSYIASQVIGGEPQDYWVGPRAMTMHAAQYFVQYPGAQEGLPDRHDSIFGPIIDAVHHGLKVAGVDIDFEYPKAQRDAEENDPKTMTKRMQVMHELTKAMYDRRRWIESV